MIEKYGLEQQRNKPATALISICKTHHTTLDWTHRLYYTYYENENETREWRECIILIIDSTMKASTTLYMHACMHTHVIYS